MALGDSELRLITDNQESPLVRCVGFLFIRYVVPPEELWLKFEEYMLDDEEIFVRQDGSKGTSTTIGEYIEGLLLKDKYLSTPIPRIPNAVRRKLEEQIAPLTQYRKRTKANKRYFMRGLPERDMPVDVCLRGVWQNGRSIEVLNRIPSRLKVRVRLDDGEEHVVHIGKLVLKSNVQIRRASKSTTKHGRIT